MDRLNALAPRQLLLGAGVLMLIFTFLPWQSVSIISINAYSGFAKHYLVLAAAGLALDWRLIGMFAAVGAGGSLAGQQIAHRLPQQSLRRAFAWLLLLMSIYMLWRSVPPLIGGL